MAFPRVLAATVATSSLLLSLAVPAAAPLYAPTMPLAARSLLLDITTVGARLVAVGERGHVLYSDDDAQSWQQARVPTTQLLTSVYFSDEQHGWAVGHDGLILVSDDAGESWRIQRDGLAVQQQLNIELREMARRRLQELEQRPVSADRDVQAQIEAELDEARMDLEDADLALEEPVFTSPLMDVWFQDGSRGWATGAFGTLLATEDGGQHWFSREQELDNPYEYHLNAITGDGSGRVFIAGEGGVMFRSLNGGETWESLEPFYQGSWFGAVYSAPNGALFIFGLRGKLFRSMDFGTSWEPVVNQSTSTLAGGGASPEEGIVLVGAVGTVLFSTDGGQSFRHTVMSDRLGLSSGLARSGDLIVVGQGGVKISEGALGEY